MITSDFHFHTSFSTDSDAIPEKMIRQGIEKGLKTICVTDHLDPDYPFYEDQGEDAFQLDLDTYFPEMEKLKEKYKQQTDLRIGMELGLQPHLGDACREVTEKYPFDFVIGSIHVVQRTDPYYGEIFQEMGDKAAYQTAFQETLLCLDKIQNFDVLGHIDYVVRYGMNREKEYAYKTFAPVLDEILRKVIYSGRGIELNTAGWKYGLGFCHPHPEILRRYRELGGEILTVGSDAHRPEHVAYEFAKAEEVLLECGFRYYTEFKGRKPIFKKLGD